MDLMGTQLGVCKIVASRGDDIESVSELRRRRGDLMLRIIFPSCVLLFGCCFCCLLLLDAAVGVYLLLLFVLLDIVFVYAVVV